MTLLGEGDVFVRAAGELCEGPCWDDRAGRLVWVDIMAGLVHSGDPGSGQVESVDLGQPVGAVAPRESGGWVAAVERGFLLLDDRWNAASPVVPAPGQPPESRFNDGRCDPGGRFWAGTLADEPGAATLYRYDGGTEVRAVIDGVTISNGLGWSLDGTTMYYADTGARTVDRMDFDAATGLPRDRRTLVSVPDAEGAPDGLVVDSEGFLWVALWDGGCIRRYSPAGDLEREVTVPVSRPTSMAFGGPGLDELFITTAWQGLTEAERATQPLAGSVFRHRPGVTGLPAARFRG